MKDQDKKSKKNIKINFADMPLSFNAQDNFVLDILHKHGLQTEISEYPDFLFYSVYGMNHYKYHNCVKIFWTVEPVVPNFNECDYAVGFDDIVFGKRYFHRPIWMFEERPQNIVLSDEQLLNRRFCNFVYSNDQNGEGAILRKKFVQKLMEYKKVDCPGRVLNNMQDAITPRDGDWKKGKLDFIQNYKFTIAFENTMYPGYTTEKLTQPLMVHSMPIYWGNPKVSDNFNNQSFILCNGYEDKLDEIVQKIVKLDNNDDLYLSMIKQNCMNDSYDEKEKEKLEEFLISIFQQGNKEYNKDPLHYDCGSRSYNAIQNQSVWQTIKKKIKR